MFKEEEEEEEYDENCEIAYERFLAWRIQGRYKHVGKYECVSAGTVSILMYRARELLLVCFEGLANHPRWLFV